LKEAKPVSLKKSSKTRGSVAALKRVNTPPKEGNGACSCMGEGGNGFHKKSNSKKIQRSARRYSEDDDKLIGNPAV